MQQNNYIVLTSDSDQITVALKRATACKKANDWLSAITILRQCKSWMDTSKVEFPIDTWCKFPLYLQQAGLYEESMKEFYWLLGKFRKDTHRKSIFAKMKLAQARQRGARK